MDLKSWIEKTPMSVAELAEELNKTPTTIYRWLNGSRSPDKKAMKKIYELSKGQVDPNSIILNLKPSILKRLGL